MHEAKVTLAQSAFWAVSAGMPDVHLSADSGAIANVIRGRKRPISDIAASLDHPVGSRTRLIRL